MPLASASASRSFDTATSMRACMIAIASSADPPAMNTGRKIQGKRRGAYAHL
jgi:hypothetical protein